MSRPIDLDRSKGAIKLTPEGTKMLKRLSKLRKQDEQATKESLSLRKSDRASKEVLQARFRARQTSSRLFEQLLCDSELRTSSSVATKDKNQTERQKVAERSKWLLQYADDIRGDKNFIQYNVFTEACGRDYVRQQVAVWEAEIVTRQRKWHEALKLVVKFKASNQAHDEERLSDIMDRLLQPSFPPELLLRVVEHLIKLRLPYFNIIESDELEKLADKCFRWPRNIASTTRTPLEQTAATAVVKVSTIKSSWSFWRMSPVLSGHENHIRRLVLEIRSTPREFAEEALSDNHVWSIATWGKRCPNLKVCVLLLHFLDKNDGDMVFFNKATLSTFNYEPSSSEFVKRKITLENMLVGVIDSFIRSGPGSRKLVRFGCGYRVLPASDIGPLVEVSTDDMSDMSAQLIFDQAFLGRRTYRSIRP